MSSTASNQPPNPDLHDAERVNEPEPLCEFTNPCTTTSTTSPSTNNPNNKEGKHPRKVISHIFGRNKSATKLFPPSVWVHYCRKHYQRARYRSTQWPFTQAELILDSLQRMERWGGVRGFDLVLRRREVERVDGGGFGCGCGEGGVRKSARVAVKGQGQAEGQGEDDGDDSVSVSGSGSPKEDQDEQPSSPDDDHTKGKGRGKGSRRKKPIIEPAPVPNWLRREVGPNKSFADVRGIISRLLDYLTGLREEGRKEAIRFPDIEILPEFQGWVLERERERERARGQVKKGRVSKRGAVQKV